MMESSIKHEDIGTADDSGFASIAGSVSSEFKYIKHEELESTIADDVKISNEPSNIAPGTIPNKVRRRKPPISEEEAEAKRVATEKYEQDIRDQRYKRLMHLLDRSQFYSSYLVQKIDGTLKPATNKPADKRKQTIVNENHPPKKKAKVAPKDKQSYNIRDYVNTKEMKEKVKHKLNLSQEEITNQLDNDSDSKSAHSVENKSDCVIPKYFNGILRDYQHEGLTWLKILYENGVNGILADEMGLGKTIQVIALLCHLIENQIPGPYLIIAPLSTIPNWLLEFERFAPILPVVLLHGSLQERKKLYYKIKTKYFNVNGYKTQPIVLTTFEVPLHEQNLLRNQQWRYIIIDEGHRIKNHQCQLVKILEKCQSMSRLLLTGTPLQNNLSELWSLLHFLLPEIFDDLAIFESWFDAKELQNAEGTAKVLKQEAEKRVLSSLREILKPFMLRRVKSDVCLDVPPKKEVVVYAPLTELQRNLYKAVLDRDLHTLSKIENESLIIPEVDGKRPKRKCRVKNEDVIKRYMDTYQESSSRESTPTAEYDAGYDDDDNDNWKTNTTGETADLSEWKQFTDITDRNQEFFVRLTMVNRFVMYKKIVNHPYLIHCPLDASGLPRVDDELIKSSGKLLVLDAMLAELKARGHKVLLFSTMVMILDVIEDYLQMRDHQYVRLDGTMKIEDRKKNINIFNTDPNVFIFLISTKAGGVGLNLAAADTVIIYDSDWNPQADIQAMARCHRIGQTRPVVIYKLYTKGTIDERIMSRAEAKRKLEKMVIDKGIQSVNLYNKDLLIQLKELLERSENHIVTSKTDVYTAAELDELLDRSDLMPKKLP